MQINTPQQRERGRNRIQEYGKQFVRFIDRRPVYQSIYFHGKWVIPGLIAVATAVLTYMSLNGTTSDASRLAKATIAAFIIIFAGLQLFWMFLAQCEKWNLTERAERLNAELQGLLQLTGITCREMVDCWTAYTRREIPQTDFLTRVERLVDVLLRSALTRIRDIAGLQESDLYVCWFEPQLVSQKRGKPKLRLMKVAEAAPPIQPMAKSITVIAGKPGPSAALMDGNANTTNQANSDYQRAYGENAPYDCSLSIPSWLNDKERSGILDIHARTEDRRGLLDYAHYLYLYDIVNLIPLFRLVARLLRQIHDREHDPD